MKKIYCADLFCGGGGTSTGMIAAFEKNGIDYELVGVNHWDKAIATNNLNHRGCYYRDGVERVSPRELVPGGRLHILWASPECTNHSRAKGGRPKDEQSRATAWDVLKWPQELFIDRIYIENVEEFMDWGPCDEKGQPIKAGKGKIFRQYIATLKSMGYRIAYQVMNAADYGAPTCRRRLIIQAVRGKQKIRWPEPTHAKEPGIFGEKQWVAAREIIDWSMPGTSIFDRKKPLAANTLRRIYSGIAKHGGKYAFQFGAALRCEIVRSCRSVDKCPFDVLAALPPISAPTCAPFMIPFFGENRNQAPRTNSVDAPMPTVTGHGAGGVVQALFIPQHGGGTVKPVSCPLPTIATTGAISVVSPMLVNFYGGERQAHSIDKPLDTVTCKDRFGLASGRLAVDELGNFILLDILFRMLQPHELAAAMSFPRGYKFAGTKTDQVKQIGNAVCPALAEALIAAALGDLAMIAKLAA